MRAIWIRKHGGPNVLEVRETPDPEPTKGQVRIRVKAAGLNFAELSARQGLYPDAPKTPCILGYEGGGVVDALGEGVTSPKIGTRVMFMSRFGAHSDTVCTPAHQAIPISDGMSFEVAAAIPVNYLTAYQALHQVGRVRSGDRVLIHMAAGGVGTAALQLCKAIGGVETFGTASAGKHDHLRAQGCVHPIDYRTKDYVEEVKRLTNDQGVDFILDPLGGSDWKKGYSILREGGMLICFGMANTSTAGGVNWFRVLGQLAQIPRYSPMTLMNDNKAVSGINLGHLWHRADLISHGMQQLLAMYGEGKIAPHIDGTYSFDRAKEAWARIEEGKNVGKVVLVP